MRSGVIVAALSTTKGPLLRVDELWMVRATCSLPEPEGPKIMMRLLVGATRSMVWRRWLIVPEPPTSSSVSPERCFSSATSRRSFEASSARSAMPSGRASALMPFLMSEVDAVSPRMST